METFWCCEFCLCLKNLHFCVHHFTHTAVMKFLSMKNAVEYDLEEWIRLEGHCSGSLVFILELTKRLLLLVVNMI